VNIEKIIVITCGLIALSMPTWAMGSRKTQKATMDYRKEVLAFIPCADHEIISGLTALNGFPPRVLDSSPNPSSV